MEMTVAPARGQGRDLSLSTLKYIAILAMLIDHIAYAFVQDGTPLAIGMHFIGRITGPVMFFSAVEGYHHTRSVSRYLTRLAAFALLSWIPFLLFCHGGSLAGEMLFRPNVIYTIFMGVLAVHIRRTMKHPAAKVLLILGLLILCVPADWGATGVVIILVFDFFYGDFKNQAFGYCLTVALDQGLLTMLLHPFFGLFYEHAFAIDWEYYSYMGENFGLLLPIALLALYRGRRGGGGAASKWFFYIFYPAHLLALGLLQMALQ